MQEVIGNELPIYRVFWFPLLQETEGFRQMVVEDHGFVPQLADQQVLFLDLLLEWQGPVEFLLRGVQFDLCTRCGFLGSLKLFSNVIEL